MEEGYDMEEEREDLSSKGAIGRDCLGSLLKRLKVQFMLCPASLFP